MPLSETDALTIRSTFDSLPEEAKPLASDWMKRYKDQQDEFGLPLFPSERAKEEDAQAERFSMFEDLKSVDAGNGIYDQAERLESGMGDKLRQREAGMRFLASQFPDVPADTVRRDFPLYRDDFAAKNGGKREMGDGEFYNFAGAHVKKQREAEDLRGRSLDAGFRAALKDGGSLEGLAKVMTSTAGDASEVDAASFLESYSLAAGTLHKHRGLIGEIMTGVSASMNGGDADLEPLKDKLLDIPGTERRMILAALRMQAERAGEAAKVEKGGKMSLTSGMLMQQTGEAAFRLAANAATGSRDVERLLDTVQETNSTQTALGGGGVKFSGGSIKTPEDARRYVKESLAWSMAGESAASSGPGGAGLGVMDTRNTITLDDQAQRLIQDAKERERKRLRVDNEIRAISEASDPIPNVFASTIGTSGAALLLMGATRGLAAPAMAGAYTNIEYNDLSLKYPQMSHADKQTIAGLSGAVQAAGDFIGFKALDKLPGIKSLISQPLTKQLAARALARGVASYATENLVEAGQDIATPALMAALKSDVPGFDWDAELRDFWKGRTDVAVGLLPLTLLGVGASSVNEYRGAKELLTWNDHMAEAGVIESDRINVIETAQSGSLVKAQGLLKEAWGRRDPAVAAEYQDLLSDRDKDLAAAREEMTRRDLIPNIARDGDGYTVRSGETVAKFKTWDEARAVATEHMNDMERAQAELVASMADSFIESTPDFLKSESIDIRKGGESLIDRVGSGVVTPEAAMEAAVAGGVIQGVTMAEARAIAHEVFAGETKDERALKFREDVEKIVVLGRNRVDGGKSRSVINMRDNERAFLTVVEEVVEGRWKGGLQRGKFSKEQGVKWVQLAESATGEKFLEGSTWEEIAASVELAPRALTEAISRIITADVFGRTVDGKRIGPGSVSRGLNLNDREQSALAAILKAFQQLFKALLQTAGKLAQARSEGKLGEEYDTLFNALTGGSSQLEHEAGAEAEARQLIDTSGYSEETPGPNTETFALAPLAMFTTKEQRDYAFGDGRYTHPVTLKNGTRLSGETFDFKWSDTDKMPTFFGYTKSGAEITIQAQYVTPDMVATSRDSGKSANDLRDRLEKWHARRGTNGETFSLASSPLKGTTGAWMDRSGALTVLTGNDTHDSAANKLTGLSGMNGFDELLNNRGFLRLKQAGWAGDNRLYFNGAPTLAQRSALKRLNEDFGYSVIQDNGERGERVIFGGETFSLSRASDAEYMAAVEAGDMETAQRMVDAAAKAAGYATEAWHGSGSGPFSTFRLSEAGGIFVALDKKEAENFAVGKDATLRRFYIRGKYPERVHLSVDERAAANQAKKRGRDGIRVSDSDGWSRLTGKPVERSVNLLVFDRNNIKSADPVTRDASGNVIPLSKRFNPADNRITYSLRSGDFASRAAAMFSPFQRTPELRMAIARVAKERAMRLGAEWIEKAAVIRSASSINREVAFREADGFDRRMTAYLDSLTPNARQNLEFEPAALEDDPLISAMLDFGKLMSQSTAKREGKVNAKDGDYDGAPWIPPTWYSGGGSVRWAEVTKDGETTTYTKEIPEDVLADIESGAATIKRKSRSIPAKGGIMPDQMAQAMHDAGLLPDAYTDTLWDALASRIESSRKDKAAYREAVQAFRDAKKTARAEAKAEAEAWGERTKKTAGSPKAQRDMLKAALRTLDGILSAAPPEVRARVGGYVKLAGLATDEAMLQEIERRVAKLNVELEKWLKKEYLQRIAKLFKRFAPKKDDKGRITSNITAEAAEDIGFAFDFASLDDANQEKEMGSVEKTLEESEDAAEIQDAIGKLAIFQLFHNLEKRESSELEAAAMWLDELGSGAREARKIIDAARAEQVKAAKDVAKADASNGKLSSLPDAENVEADARSSTFKRFMSDVKGFLNSALFTMGQQLEIVFGQDSRITTEFHRRAVRAANDSTDIKRDIEARRAAFVADLFGTTSRIKQAGRMGALTVPTASGVIIETGGKTKTIDVPAEIVVRIIEGTADLKALGFTKEEAATLADAWADNEALPVKRQKRVFQIERRSDGKDVELTMSQDEAIQYLLWSNQKASREQMERDGWSKESFQQLNAFLSDDARALAKFFADEYARMGRLIEPVYRRMFHAPFPQVANYSPIFRDISKADSIIDIDQQGHGSGVSSGFILARNKNARSALRRTSAISAFMQHAESAAHWIAHVELVRDLRSVLIDKEVQNAIRSSGRTAAANGIKKRVMQLENQGKVGAAGIAELDSWGSRLLQARAFKGLAWRISPVMKQASAYFNPLLADVPAWDYMRGTARLLSGQLDVSAMWNSPDIQRRIVMGFSAEARIAMDKLGYTGSTLLAAMSKGMLPMQLVDAGWTTAGAAVAFDYYRRNNIKSGMNETLAENAALDQLEMMIAESAQPADPANRSLIEGLQNPWLKSMWMFSSESRKTLAVEIMALRRLATGKSKNKAMDVQRAVVAHVIMATTTQLMAGVLSLLMGDDDDREREWSVEEWAAAIAAGPINGLFLFGDAFNYIGRRLFGLHAFEPSTAIGQAVKAVSSAPSILDEAISGEPEEQRKAILKLGEAFGQAASIVGPGNPFTAVDVIIGNPLKDAEKILSRVEE